ncbi:hypothetical protein [Bacillus sp. PS06]|uniref:hypothetical protein n=1 Tax=Bacillus sp. PS06 TaxID=2764176 RepID=UPI001783B4F6|nr:hypothetical protein [Bacillus sp. PS06]MBD8068593.1 hypothetical protein [Bacillus sp. PS06]
MDFTFDFSYNLVSTITTLFSWAIILFLFIIYYKKSEKPPVWKAIIILILGRFSFNFNLNVNMLISIPILPLGVWIAYWILKRNNQQERWKRYRTFAWLGFFSNFVFLLISLLNGPMQQLIYPNNSLSTFVSDIDNAQVMVIHPSGTEVTLQSTYLLKDIESGSMTEFNAQQWYNDTTMTGWESESNEMVEKFPYQLIGTKPKSGSGLQTVIYIEQDGKGLLISTPKEQLYYRLPNAIIEVKEGL